MKELRLLYLLMFCATSMFAQEYSITGKVSDTNNKPISFVNVLVFEENADEAFKGSTTNEEGFFKLEALEEKTYKLTFSYVGYQTITKTVTVSSEENIGTITLNNSTENLEETVVYAKQPTITRKGGKLVFNVANTSLSIGNSFDIIKKTPGVLVFGDNISIKNQPTTVYLNDKRIYLSPSETVVFLRNLDASIIESVEVITSPSAKYDAEAGTILNINTTRPVDPGYKGSVNGTYRQAVFAKYQIGTSHFYKNDWLNFYGSYSYNPKKLNRDQESYIRFFEPDETSTASIWEGDFNRQTKSYAHQANVFTDFTLDENNSITLGASLLLSPNTTYDNSQFFEIFNAQRQLDSTFTSHSDLEKDLSNLTVNVGYATTLDEDGSLLSIGANYIAYNSDQYQNVITDYFLPNGNFLRNNSFYTLSDQKTNILTGNADLSTTLFSGSFDAGIKYSSIDTDTGLDFFDVVNNSQSFNPELSDVFLYEESIYAAYIDFAKEFEKFDINIGLRTEYTDVEGDSRSLGKVNTQNYFEWFPSISLNYQLSENHELGINYARKIERPRYQSLNPFKYFINENNFNTGNPNLRPAIDNKITLSYTYNSKWSFEAYYQHIDHSLEMLNYQNNDTRILRQIDANMINFFQYSFDVSYASSLNNWWFLSLVTSTYYLENDFLALESSQEIAKNNTAGFFGQLYNNISLSKDRTFSADVVAVYFSNLISGSLDYNNIFNFSVSFRKSFWDNKASVFMGVDDIFNTNNVPVTSRYLNQDNSYFTMPESRVFKVGFTYNFGNFQLNDNQRSLDNDENNRLEN